MVAGCVEGDGSKLFIIARQGNLGGEILYRKLVGCNMDLRKLQIIFNKKGFERRASEASVHVRVTLCDRINLDLFYRQMHLHVCRKKLFFI